MKWKQVGLFALSILFIAGLMSNCGGKTHSEESEGKDTTQTIPVEVSTVEFGDVAAYYSSTATLEAEQESEVVAKVSGVVKTLMVEEGDYVKAGQPLAQLDDEQLALEAKRAEATMNQRMNEYRRNKELFEKDLVSVETYDNARFAYENQRANYELTKLRLEYATIKAPIGGVVSRRMVKVGNMVNTNQPVFHISDFSPLLAILHVPEHEMSKFQIGQRTVLRADAIPAETFEGEILRISPTVDPATGTFKVTVAVNDKSQNLKPGMFGRLQVVYDIHHNTLTMPKEALISEDDSRSVFIVKDGMSFRKEVRPGYVNGSKIEILSGLQSGDSVVTIGQSSLNDSSLVEVITY